MAKTVISRSIGIGATVTDILSGKNIEFSPVTGELIVSATASATGLNLQMYAGSDEVLETSPVSAQNRVPIVPDDMVLNEVIVNQGTKLRPVITNPTAGAITIFLTVEVTENSPLAQEYLASQSGF